MTLFRRVFLSPVGPNLFGARGVRAILGVIGVFTFVGGALHLPSLGLPYGEWLICFFLLMAVMLLCVAVGQLFVILELLEARNTD